MKPLLLLLLLAATAFAAPAEFTVEYDVDLPLVGTNTVRLYERTGAAPPFQYRKAAELPITSALATGVLTVPFPKVLVPDDGQLHVFVARTAAVPVLPATTVTAAAESADSTPVNITIKPGGAGPKAGRVTVITLK